LVRGFAYYEEGYMSSESERDEVIRFAAGRSSTVRDAGNHAWTQGGNLVEKTGDREVVHGGDRIRVIDNAVFVNGSYQGSVNR
jgi:hypothetical protein